MSDEFLYRWPGAKHLMSLIELEQKMDKILADRIAADIEALKRRITDTAELEQKMDKIIAEDYDKVNRAMTNTMVEVFDTRILRRHTNEVATLGKMSASSIVQKFQ